MARHTQATLTARVGMVARALGLPLQPHSPNGFNVGALWLIRIDARWVLFQITGTNGAKESILRGDAGDVVSFLDGMIAAANAQSIARRRVLLPSETAS